MGRRMLWVEEVALEQHKGHHIVVEAVDNLWEEFFVRSCLWHSSRRTVVGRLEVEISRDSCHGQDSPEGRNLGQVVGLDGRSRRIRLAGHNHAHAEDLESVGDNSSGRVRLGSARCQRKNPQTRGVTYVCSAMDSRPLEVSAIKLLDGSFQVSTRLEFDEAVDISCLAL